VTTEHPSPLDLTGLQPTHASGTVGESALLFNSLAVEEVGGFTLSTSWTEGQTTLLDSDATYSSYYGSIPRFNAAQGDSVWVLQSEGRDAGTPPDAGRPWTSSSVVAAAHLDPFSFDGGSLPIKASLSSVPQQDVHLEWHREEFDALRSASAASGSNYTFVEFYPMLHDTRDGWIDFAVSPMLALYPGRSETQSLVTRDLTYGNPYPSAWEPIAFFYHSYFFSQPNHDGSRSATLTETSELYLSVSGLASQPAVKPVISMPRDLKVDGLPAFPSRLLETTTPQVTWEAPALGTPSDYVLVIRRSNPTPPTRPTIARIYMSPEHRSVRLPPGLLSAGNTYILELSASHADPLPPGQLPSMRYVLPYASSTTTSGLLTVP
jgi:hypothetical protein